MRSLGLILIIYLTSHSRYEYDLSIATRNEYEITNQRIINYERQSTKRSI